MPTKPIILLRKSIIQKEMKMPLISLKKMNKTPFPLLLKKSQLKRKKITALFPLTRRITALYLFKKKITALSHKKRITTLPPLNNKQRNLSKRNPFRNKSPLKSSQNQFKYSANKKKPPNRLNDKPKNNKEKKTKNKQ